MKKNRKRRQIRRGRILTITLFFLIALFGYSKAYQISIENELKRDRDKLQTEIDMINMEIESLEDDIEKSQTLEFVEKTAREDYNMIKPREIIYIFEEGENGEAELMDINEGD